MARLGPRIGKHEKHAVDGFIGQALQQDARILVPYPQQVGHRGGFLAPFGHHARQQGTQPVLEHLAGKVAHIGIGGMLGQRMFTTPETDFQPDLLWRAAKARRRVRDGGLRKTQPWQCLVQQPLLARAQRMAALPPVKPVWRCLYIHGGRHMSENPAPAAMADSLHGMITPAGGMMERNRGRRDRLLQAVMAGPRWLRPHRAEWGGKMTSRPLSRYDPSG